MALTDRSRSPLVRPPGRTDLAPPAAHTDAELAALMALLTASRTRTESVAVGHGRDGASQAAASAFVDAWQAARGAVLAVVDWPEEAASWLRPALRLTAGAPDAWVVAGGAQGWAQMSRRLRYSTGWRPDRTFAFASAGDIEVVRLAGAYTLEGLRGASADGGTWRVGRGLITYYNPES